MKLRFFLFAVVLCLGLGVTNAAADVADEDTEENDDDRVEAGKASPDVLLAHVYVDSKFPDKSQKSAGLPQTISHKKAVRLWNNSPIRYYAGSTRQRLHICGSQKSDDDFYVWYAWRGPDLKRDGYMVQVFQFRSAASVQDVANALKQYGELDEENPFVQFDNAQILTFLYAMAQQREARSSGGLVGVHVFLQPWRRLYSDGITEEEIEQAIKVTETLAEEAATSILKAPARIRTAPELADGKGNSFNYVVIEEDSDFGRLYDQLWSLFKYFGYDPGTKYGQKWGKRAIYKFLTNTTELDIKAGIRAFHSGKISSKRLEALMEKAWQTSNDKEAAGNTESTDSSAAEPGTESSTADLSDPKETSPDSGIEVEL